MYKSAREQIEANSRNTEIKTIHCTKQDAQEQIRLIFGALPLDARRFNLDAIAEMCAKSLELMTINQKKIN